MASQAIEDLRASVAALDTVNDSAIALINGFNQRLADGIAAARAGDFSDLVTLKSDLDREVQQLADAVVANTPATP